MRALAKRTAGAPPPTATRRVDRRTVRAEPRRGPAAAAPRRGRRRRTRATTSQGGSAAGQHHVEGRQPRPQGAGHRGADHGDALSELTHVHPTEPFPRMSTMPLVGQSAEPTTFSRVVFRIRSDRARPNARPAHLHETSSISATRRVRPRPVRAGRPECRLTHDPTSVRTSGRTSGRTSDLWSSGRQLRREHRAGHPQRPVDGHRRSGAIRNGHPPYGCHQWCSVGSRALWAPPAWRAANGRRTETGRERPV